jgi:hypothetical protein
MNKSLSPYGYTDNEKVYLFAYMDFPERELGFVRESDEASIEYFTKRFALAETKVTDLIDSIHSSQNKGSYLMKLIHLRQYLAEFNALGDFPALFARLDVEEVAIREYVLQNRGKNLDIKTALLIEAEALKYSTAWGDTAEKYKELKMKWIKTGSSPSENEEELNQKFNATLDYFFAQRNAFVVEKNRLIDERKQQYQDLINKLRKVINEKTENRIEQIKKIQSDWRNVGNIPKRQFVFYSRIFKNELNNFFAKRKENQKPKLPIEQKEDMCARVERMLENPDNVRLDEVRKIQEEWKNLGKLPDLKDKDLNTKFKIACNEIFEYNFLVKTAKLKYESFALKTRFEQLKIKIRLLKDTLKEDETVLNSLNVERNRLRYGVEQPPMTADHINLINKIKTKQRILKKLQDQLDGSY